MTRQIHPDLVNWFDAKAKKTAEFQAALVAGIPRQIFMRAMISTIGVREVGGNNRGPLVELFQTTLGNAEREPWCMSLVQSALAYAELRSGKLSPIAASEHCLTVWNETPKSQHVEALPVPGAIIIWRHGTTQNGHTGCTISEVAHGKFFAVEGNTESGLTNAGHIERDGGGCYETSRNLIGAGSMKVFGFLKPF